MEEQNHVHEITDEQIHLCDSILTEVVEMANERKIDLNTSPLGVMLFQVLLSAHNHNKQQRLSAEARKRIEEMNKIAGANSPQQSIGPLGYGGPGPI